MQEIRSAFSAGDINRLHRHSHTLKGVALNFDAHFLAELAGHLEQLCKREKLAGAEDLILLLEKETARASDYLEGILGPKESNYGANSGH
jgi:HPt (histidine-containing phosphotransfer) domain-containing protein